MRLARDIGDVQSSFIFFPNELCAVYLQKLQRRMAGATIALQYLAAHAR